MPQRKNVKLRGEKGWESKATGGGSQAGSVLKSEVFKFGRGCGCQWVEFCTQ